MRAGRRKIWQVTAVVIGLLVALILVLGAYVWFPARSPGTVRFGGVELNITYTGTSSGFFGPTGQNACLEQSPFSGSAFSPNCPSNLTGGGQYSFFLSRLGGPSNVSWVFINVSIHGPIPFQAALCGSPVPPTPGLIANLSQPFASGNYCTLSVMFTAPNPAPDIPGGLWMFATMSVHSL